MLKTFILINLKNLSKEINKMAKHTYILSVKYRIPYLNIVSLQKYSSSPVDIKVVSNVNLPKLFLRGDFFIREQQPFA